MSASIKLVIMDTHDLSRNGIAAIVAKQVPEAAIVEVLSERRAIDRCLRENAVDLLLLDDALPGATEINQVLREVQRRYPDTAVLVLSQKLQVAYIQQLLEDGAEGFVYKGERLEEMLPLAIRTVQRGELFLSPRASVLPYQSGSSAEVSSLATRELQVLQLLHNGLSISEIADELHVERKAVYRSLNKLKQALGARTNEQIVPAAHRKGLL
jgi:DNA-binding NarL/FixJ family response regulator